MTRVLVAVVTGGRPRLEDRPTTKLFAALAENGLTDVEWVVRSDHAESYERDEHPVNIYPVEWADAYSRAHWRHPTFAWEAGGFHGAFPGREWAMRTAEDRGYEAVLQLDDNVCRVGLMANPDTPYRKDAMTGGRALALLPELALSTNAWMLGPQLNAVFDVGKLRLIRPGYPYSCYVERVGPGRMPYYGPFEDDIMHALEYALHGGVMRTAAVCEVFRYQKRHGTRDGMRSHYDPGRGLEIARRYPRNVKLRKGYRTTSTRPTGTGVRHILNTRGFTPVRVTDRVRFQAVETEIRAAVQAALKAERDWNQAKITRRAAGA